MKLGDHVLSGTLEAPSRIYIEAQLQATIRCGIKSIHRAARAITTDLDAIQGNLIEAALDPDRFNNG